MGQRRRPPQDLSIHTTVPSGSTFLGTKASSSGAAGSTTSVANRRHRQPQQILTIARMDSRTGRPGGRCPRKNGAAVFMEEVARTREVDAPRRLSRTIAMLDLQTGWRVGPWPRRHGAVRTRAGAVLQQLEDVLEHSGSGRTINFVEFVFFFGRRINGFFI